MKREGYLVGDHFASRFVEYWPKDDVTYEAKREEHWKRIRFDDDGP
ncbi:MAG: hypothetical protein ACO1SV_21385 [Fimbriimonas sp.]